MPSRSRRNDPTAPRARRRMRPGGRQKWRAGRTATGMFPAGGCVALERQMHARFPAAECDELAGYFRKYGADAETATRMYHWRQ